MSPPAVSDATEVGRPPVPAASVPRTIAPIFVVGVARSGTTLLASMLGGHPRLDCGPESRFFFGLERASTREILADPEWPAAAVRFIASLVTNKQPTHTFYGLDLEEIRRFLAERRPSVPVLLESLTVPHAARAGKPRWVEKTTDHLVHVEQVRRYWPDARIIRIVRDPRDVALSLRFVPFGSPSIVANLYFWADRDARSAPFFERDSGSLTVRYEDLLRDPRSVLTRICEFVGEPFDGAMLETDESARRVAGAGEVWKEKARTPVDPSRAEVWRRELTEEQRVIASVVCSDGLTRYGFPEAATVALRVAFQPLVRESVERHETLIAAFARHRIRLEPWAAGATDVAPGPRLGRILLSGRPGQLRWRWRPGRVGRARGAVGVWRALFQARRRGPRPWWIAADNGLSRSGGVFERGADLAVQLFTRRLTAERVVRRLGAVTTGEAD